MTFYDDLLSAGRDEPARFVRVERGSDRAVVTLDDPESSTRSRRSRTASLR